VSADAAPAVCIRRFGEADYRRTLDDMRQFTDSRDADTPDQLWLLQHPKIFTQGVAGRAEHLLAPGDIPVLQVDRGGQVTYHGPGQWVLYLLVDLRRRGLGVRALVDLMENALVDTLAGYGIRAAPHLCHHLAPGRG
jgi:lipoyl(octanoyl) transferase